MRIFLSYPSEYHKSVEPVALALRNVGHTVFLDKDDLPPGADFNEQIKTAVDQSDLMIFFITPESVEEGRFTRSELSFARKKWPGPAGHVLPVMLRATPREVIPAYLESVQILTPQGNLAAEVQSEVARMAPGVTRKIPQIRPPWKWLLGGAAAAAVIGVALLSNVGPDTSRACAYRDGPKAGMLEVAPWGTPWLVGSPCTDHFGSLGVIVSEGDAARVPPIDKRRFTKRCHFATGPRAGEAATMSMALHFGIGIACHDGAGSIGIGVPE